MLRARFLFCALVARLRHCSHGGDSVWFGVLIHREPIAVHAAFVGRGVLDGLPDPFSRATLPGHITGSAIVLDPALERVLVIWHERLGRWLQPGGHTEPDDESPLGTALRELAEETGMDVGSLAPGPLVHVDVHDIPPKGSEPAHRHHDFRFAFTVATDRVPDHSPHQAEWVALDALAARGADASLRAAVESALRRLA